MVSFSNALSHSLHNHVLSQFRAKLRKPAKYPCIVKSLINLCSRGQLRQAVDHLELLVQKGVRLDSKTLALLLQLCANTRSLKEGKWVHLHLKLTGRKHPDTFISNHLINMYCSCGDFIEGRKVFDKMSVRNLYSWNNMLSGYAKLGMLNPARRLFEKMPEKDVVSWNTMVIAYAQSGNWDEALRFYSGLRRKSIGFNAFSFAGVLIVGVKLKDVGLTRQVHCQVFVAGYMSNVVLASSILDAYAKCGEIGDARRVFDDMPVRDVFAWTALISGHAKLGYMESARELFDIMPKKNPVSWTALVSGYARNGLGHSALELFQRMMFFRVMPDQFTFSSCLTACASIASLKHGKQIHAYLIRIGFRPNKIVVSSLIDMYSKCGSLELCKLVFELSGDKLDVMLWNPMMSALAQHGFGAQAAQLFRDMLVSGVKPNRVTFVVILNACSHSGLVKEGLALFNSMTSDHGILPDEEHYACLIDLLGRAGHFDELINQLEKMPFKADDRIWNALVGVCSIHGNEVLGKKAAECLIELEPQFSGAYLLLSSVYAASGKWESVEKIRQLMYQRCVRKEQASSWVEMQNKIHGCVEIERNAAESLIELKRQSLSAYS
ncbi:Pentatricopeptide repeat-containing protein At2g21090 [Ancistrocladus abbreviatus]